MQVIRKKEIPVIPLCEPLLHQRQDGGLQPINRCSALGQDRMDTSQGHKILVLHADPIFGVLFQRMLARCNDEVRFISDGWQGLTVAQQEHPAIIFIYLWTPGLNAFEFYEHLHMTHPILDTRLVFYGGMPVERVYPQIRPLQVSGYLAQPFGIQELIRVRNTVLNGETYFQFGRSKFRADATE